jgi:hypothetical protein
MEQMRLKIISDAVRRALPAPWWAKRSKLYGFLVHTTAIYPFK